MTDIDKKIDILKQLNLLADDKKSKKETFRLRAYQNAILSIKEYEGEIKTKKDLDNISGLSKGSIRTKIEEFIKTGEISQVKDIQKDNPSINVINDLSNIYGVGPSKANELVNKFNILSIEDLKEKYNKDNKILNDKQKIGLEYYDDLLKKIPRKEMEKHEKFITDFIKKIDKNDELVYEIAGSFRRGASKSGDIDVLCSSKNENNLLFYQIIDSLEKEDYIKETLAKGEKKFMGISKLHRHKTNRRLDIIYTKKIHYPFALLYFTGSAQLNVFMRNHALSMGYSLNEYGLKKDGQFIDNNGKPFETEEDIFDFLELNYINPLLRNSNYNNNYKN
jgi:DNA polymerase beta